MTKEVQALTDMLEKEAIQTYVVNRWANSTKSQSRDLMFEGSLYPNTAAAFQNFHKERRQMENLGPDGSEDDEEDGEASGDEADEQDEGEDEHNDEIDDDDLMEDNEESYEMRATMLAAATEMVDEFAAAGDTMV